MKRDKRKDRRKKQERSSWYQLRPLNLLLPVVYVAGLVAVPLVQGRVLDSSVLMEAVFAGAITIFAALLLAWFAWRICKYSDFAANGAFAMVVIAAGVWSLVLTSPQRAEASAYVQDTVNEHVAELRAHAETLLPDES
ncbi:MAG: hypothetical protein ACYTG1_03645 [Planctomycetota bacterium]|jgi:protein-S-isoprenylcysteine O-methyltransferase Ste14